MHVMHREANGNGRAAVHQHGQKYPTIHVPHHKLFACLTSRLCEILSFRIELHCGWDQTSYTPDAEEAVASAIQNKCRTSIRAIALIIGVRHSSVQRVLREQSLQLLHFQRFLTLIPKDDCQEKKNIRRFLQRTVAQLNFPSCVLLTDETIFSRDILSTLITAIFGSVGMQKLL